ncbi:MAG TPA: NADH-quinone oxidoreductase subunit L [Thermoanaerobaculia bacterium]|nr:NADH-quinone oxidoreductase subunit L [Thermoanaerobaculia bacterium]HQR66164.1 NADH-quinone oxidoreductase subunit L [Thermoanaerobaculia bacterium]
MTSLWWIPALPLLGFVLNGAVALASSTGRARRGEGGGPLPYGERLFHGVVGVGTVGLSGVLAFAALVPWAQQSMAGGALPVVETAFRWMFAGDFSVDVAFRLDALSALMLSFVTFVGTLIHLYSVGYMQEEEGYGRYFAFLNLFMFAMLTLVLGANLPVLFIGWEGVGLCSYLLIGYYYDKDFAVAAGKKAFVTNRVGDVGFVLGIFGVLALFGTTDFSFLEAAKHRLVAEGAPLSVYVVCVLLFLGACGKSAQVPLYVWLPDAMAGPTPVSALIHAATMVTAGVYLVARTSAVFVLAPDALTLVAWVGAGTAIFAASIGLAQNDIKKVLAYSTVSQLGYMFLACGVGAFAAGMFHVFTHAFFKACLFLGSGSVIHAMHHEQDMRKMGGLAPHVPQTYRTMLVATLAIAGIVPLSGFFSKDQILGSVAASGQWALYAVGVATAAMTAFYMFRLVRMTFAGEFRGTHEQEHHLHESPATMTVPLWVLAAGSVVAGFIWVPMGVSNLLPRFLAPALAEGPEHEMSHGAELGLMALSLGAALAGIALAVRWYTGRPAPAHAAGLPAEQIVVSPAAAAFCEKTGTLGTLVKNKWNVDEGIEAGVLGPFRSIGRFLWKGFDALFIDGIANASAFLVELSGDLLRFFTTGNVRNYALGFTLGALVLVAYALFR